MPRTRASRITASVLGAAAAGALLSQQPAPAIVPTIVPGDQVAVAAKKLADASYPLVQQIDWAKSPALNKWLSSAAEGWSPGKELAQAVHSTLELGVSMDPKLVAQAVEAHDKAVVDAMSSPTLVTPLEDHEAVTVAIAKMFESANPAQVKAVFDTYSKVGLKAVNNDWFASVDKADAFKSYKAFLELKSYVQNFALPWNQPRIPQFAPDYSDKLGAAAKDLADASYPMLKQINWESTPVLTKWLAESSKTWEPAKIAKAVDSTLKASAAMDPKLISEAVAAHDKAVLHAIDQPGLVAPLADHEAVTESIVRMLVSAPADKVKAVFDTYAEVGLKDLNQQWFSTMKAEDAEAAYKSFLALSEVVKAQAAAPAAAAAATAAAA